ncbi:MAG: 3-dehydroquinate synthase [Tissierellia bacterium]|nr:3-dehydroquinate synthase [Tissierellia bacterium]
MNININYMVLEGLEEFLNKNNIDKLYIITDNIVYDLYIDYLINAIGNKDYSIFIIEAGEENKNMNTVFSIYDDLLEKNIDRNTLILAFGGGVVGDIAGFVASSYKGGLKYVQIPTTLLSQVDSSIGGKVGVDYGGYKNIIGSFYFPEKTFIDTYFLSTLPKREITSGLGEILKYGLIEDYELFQYTRENLDKIYNRDINTLNLIINKSVSIKEKIVGQDKKDLGLRKILNFGHTIGHSIEAYYGFSKFNHGEAVILGMLYESYIAKSLRLIDRNYYNEIYNTLSTLARPIKFDEDQIEDLLKIMGNDKKNISDEITIVLPVDRGRVHIFNNIDKNLIIDSLKGEELCL